MLNGRTVAAVLKSIIITVNKYAGCSNDEDQFVSVSIEYNVSMIQRHAIPRESGIFS